MNTSMLTTLITALIGCPVLSVTAAQNDTPEENQAGAMVICLATPDEDRGGMACNAAKKEFFKIVKYKKYHDDYVPDLKKTSKERQKKLDTCDGSKQSDTVRIIARYGMIIK